MKHTTRPGRVKVYWNVHKKVFSVVDKNTGKVILHTRYVQLTDAYFTINHNARKRIAAGGNKEVHAYIHGTLEDGGLHLPMEVPQKITYNPRRDEFWRERESGLQVTGASYVRLTAAYGFPEVWADAAHNDERRI